MLLVVDVGNTNITFGVFDGDEMVTRFIFQCGYQEHLMNTAA